MKLILWIYLYLVAYVAKIAEEKTIKLIFIIFFFKLIYEQNYY